MARRFRVPRIVTGNTMGTTVTGVVGLNEVMALLKALETELPAEYERVLTEYGEKIEVSAKSKIHSVTGNLINSFLIKKKFTSKRKVVSVIAGGRAAPHAHLVEFGHRMITKTGQIVGDVPPKKFMRPAFEENLPPLIAELESILNI